MDEDFTITLQNPSEGTKLIGEDVEFEGYGKALTATILNDDAVLSIDPETARFTKIEGPGGTSRFLVVTVNRVGSKDGEDWVNWNLTSSGSNGADNEDLGQPNDSIGVFDRYSSSFISIAALSGSQSVRGSIELPKSGYLMVAYNRDEYYSDASDQEGYTTNLPFDQFFLKNLSITGGTITSLGEVTNRNALADDVAIGASGAKILSSEDDPWIVPNGEQGGHRVVISSQEAMGGVYFKITGKDAYQNSIEEYVRGPVAGGQASTTNFYTEVTSVETVSAGLALGYPQHRIG
jgi:hypothetical protein